MHHVHVINRLFLMVKVVFHSSPLSNHYLVTTTIDATRVGNSADLNVVMLQVSDIYVIIDPIRSFIQITPNWFLIFIYYCFLLTVRIIVFSNVNIVTIS